MDNQEIVQLQTNIQNIKQCYVPCLICNTLIISTNNSINYTELCCLNCFNYLNSINLWNISNNISLIYNEHKIYKHKVDNFYIITETILSKNPSRFKKIAYHYATKMKSIYCAYCLKDIISFHNILDNFCPQCNSFNSIKFISYRWIIITNKYTNFQNIRPRLKFCKKTDLLSNFIGPIEIYNQDFFNYEKIFLIKNMYFNQQLYKIKK